MARHQRNGAKETRKLERRRERQAAKQAIAGGHSRQPHRGRWRTRAERSVIIDG
jgi:hypothetical protein